MDRGFLSWIVIGLVAGVLAKLITPGRDPGGCLLTIVLGVGGALIAGFVGQATGFYRPGQPAGWIAATLGAVVILLVWRQFDRSRRR